MLVDMTLPMKTSLLSSLVALGAGCVVRAGDLPVVGWQGRTMGSPDTVKIVDGKLTEAQVNALKAEIENTLKEVTRRCGIINRTASYRVSIRRWPRSPSRFPRPVRGWCASAWN